MATTPQANPVENLTPEQIAEQLAQKTTGQDLPEQELQTETGSVFKYRTNEELIAKLKHSVEEGTRTIAQLNRERKEAQQAPPPPVPAQDVFDSNRYYQLWAQDPNAAEDYRFKARHGLTEADAVAAMTQAVNFAQEVRPKTVIAEWQAGSDFPTSDPAERDKAGDAMDEVWQEMFPNGAPVTAQNLEMVHAVCLKRGMYQPEGAQAQSTASGSTPMPTISGASASNAPPVDINSMSPEQIRKLIETMQPR